MRDYLTTVKLPCLPHGGTKICLPQTVYVFVMPATCSSSVLPWANSGSICYLPVTQATMEQCLGSCTTHPNMPCFSIRYDAIKLSLHCSVDWGWSPWSKQGNWIRKYLHEDLEGVCLQFKLQLGSQVTLQGDYTNFQIVIKMEAQGRATGFPACPRTWALVTKAKL